MIAGLAEKLSDLREKNGWTQKYVGSRIGVQKATISSYENKVATPKAEVLIKLADLYKVSVDYLLGLEKDPSLSVKDLSRDQIDAVQKLIDMLRDAHK